MSVGEIYKKMQRETAGLLSNSVRQSLPLIARHNGKVCLAVILLPSTLRAPEGTRVWPPTHVTFYDVSNSELVELLAVTPSFFGQTHPEDESLGLANLPEGLDYDTYLDLRRTLFEAYDRLLPAFAADAQRLSQEESQAAATFRTLFPRLREASMQPYYEHLRQGFAQWLDNADKDQSPMRLP